MTTRMLGFLKRLFRRASDDRVWCLVGNVGGVRGTQPTADEATGTKHFSFGTKVYCFPPQWGDGYENIVVIGKHRGSRRSVMMVMPSKRITNWRVQPVHKPEVLRLLEQGLRGRGAVRWRKRDAKSMARGLRELEARRRTGGSRSQEGNPMSISTCVRFKGWPTPPATVEEDPNPGKEVVDRLAASLGRAGIGIGKVEDIELAHEIECDVSGKRYQVLVAFDWISQEVGGLLHAPPVLAEQVARTVRGRGDEGPDQGAGHCDW